MSRAFRRPILAAFGAASLLAVGSAGAGVVYHVDVDAPSGGGAGTSWANAFKSLQLAFDTAMPGDEIWVKQGVYVTPGTAYLMREGTAVYGGFAGVETARSQADPSSNPTILDAQKVSRVLAMSGAGPTVMDGFTLRNGLTGDEGGGALYDYHLEVDFSRCDFVGNKAVGGDGGAVKFYGGDVSFTDCRFIDNVAGNAEGGAVEHYGGDVWFERCVFDGNKSIVAGVYRSYGGSCTFLNSLFVRNRAFGTASIADTYQSTMRFIHCTATMNTADGDYAVDTAQSNVEVHNSIFHGNTYNAAYFGTGKPFPGAVTVTHSVVETGFPGQGNVDADPNFIQPSADDFRPLFPSPVLDAGDSSQVPAGVTIDLAGAPRFVDLAAVGDTGFGPPPHPDMGAYEAQCENPPVAYGDGCVGAGSLVPQIVVNSCPAIGAPLALVFTNAVGGSTAIVFAGAGMGNVPIGQYCTFLVHPILPPLFSLPLGGSGPGNGHAVLSGVVPPTTPVGAVVTWQFFVMDPNAGDGFAASPGLRLTFN
ncbi:MAG: right-handed parallel beta-helix repeat-containing protein [Planctomycetota bacterium JB042]